MTRDEAALRTTLLRNIRVARTLGLTIPARIMLDGILTFRDCQDEGSDSHKWATEICEALSGAIVEAWQSMPRPMADAGCRLQAQVKAHLMRGFFATDDAPGRPILLVCIAAIQLLNQVMDRGEVVLCDGPARDAIEQIIQAVNDIPDQRDAMWRSANRVAARWLSTCETLKLYTAPVTEAA